MNIKEKILNYFELAKEIHKYFGYTEDWVCIPMDDHMEDYWMVTGKGNSKEDHVVYSPKPFTEESITDGMEIYGGTLYTQRFLPKWVYRGKEFTMISVDTHTDGNKFLMIFDNKKECKDKDLKEFYLQAWKVLC